MGPVQPRILRGIILGVTLLLVSAATGAAAEGEAGQVDEFLRYGADVRSMGMGRANVALADDASAIYYNPAGLLRIRRGYSLYAMHFNPFCESHFNFVSLATARPEPRATGLRGFFFGPGAAYGVSFVHLGSDGYQQRDHVDNLLVEDFGLNQWALLFAFAREASGTAGILGYGVTLKVVGHGITGTTGEYGASESGFGLDLGAQWQMINPPLLKELTRVPLIGTFFQLKHLMPLRLGLSIRNVVSPDLGYGGESDNYPTALRLGGSYRLPTDWLVKDSRLFLVSDFEWLYDDMDRLIHLDRTVEIHNVAPGDGQYFGTEFEYRTSKPKLQKLRLSPRFGVSHVYDDYKLSFGLGLACELWDADWQFDFAQGIHEELHNDQRVSLTIRFGGGRKAGYYYDGAETQTGLSPKVNLLHVLSEYPDDRSLVRFARDSLASTLDTLNRMRYLEMFIDLSLGDYWYMRARQELEKGNPDLANMYTERAIGAYDGVRRDTSIVFSDEALLNNAESYAIRAITESDEGDAREDWERAAELAADASGERLRSAYLQGRSAKGTGDLTRAIEHFEDALDIRGKDSRSMRLLSRYELGDCLMESGRSDSSVKVLKTFFDDPNGTADSLEEHYPRFPAYPDRRLADDALYMVADYYRNQGQSRRREALLMFGNLCRFYPDLDMCRDSDVERRIDELVRQISE